MTTKHRVTAPDQQRLFDPDEQTSGKTFRLDLETRQRNLAHIARIRRQIAERRSAA